MILTAITNLEAEGLFGYMRDRVGSHWVRPAVAPWPGDKFMPDSVWFKALLGTPPGKAASIFLFQHKEMFGSAKVVESISLYDVEEFFHLKNMLFEIGDA